MILYYAMFCFDYAWFCRYFILKNTDFPQQLFAFFLFLKIFPGTHRFTFHITWSNQDQCQKPDEVSHKLLQAIRHQLHQRSSKAAPIR